MEQLSWFCIIDFRSWISISAIDQAIVMLTDGSVDLL